MPLDSDHAIDPPLRPPEPAEPGLWRWLVAAALVLVIIVGAYQAYEWLVNDVARRRAVAEAPAAAPTQHPAPDTGAPTAEPARRTIRPAQPSAPPNEGTAPAVTGEAIHKCVVDGQVTYTNQACPDGSTGGLMQATGADPNGVSGWAPATRASRPRCAATWRPRSRGSTSSSSSRCRPTCLTTSHRS